jgi:nicotinamide riboside transporter PnuC
MDWSKFLNLLATILGALGAIFVMQSIATMSPELMLRQTQTHWDFSSSQIEAIASQKAENRAGIVFVLLAFILAFLTILFNLGGVRLFKSKLLALVLASFIAVIIYV